jgi:hypothetical protein
MERRAAKQLADQLQDVARGVAQPAAQATIAAAVQLLRQFAEITQDVAAPFEPLTISSADSRLKAAYGNRVGGVLQIRNESDRRCHVLYGPYVSLPAGSYRFELSFSSATAGPEPVLVDLSHRQGNRELYSRPCLAWELASGIIRISCTLDHPVEDLELRLAAGPGFAAAITGLSIMRRD